MFFIFSVDLDELWPFLTTDSNILKANNNENITFDGDKTSSYNEHTKRHYCKCGRSYKQRGTLTDHIKWECGKDPSFSCTFCPYLSKRKTNMVKHVRAIHKAEFIIKD